MTESPIVGINFDVAYEDGRHYRFTPRLRSTSGSLSAGTILSMTVERERVDGPILGHQALVAGLHSNYTFEVRTPFGVDVEVLTKGRRQRATDADIVTALAARPAPIGGQMDDQCELCHATDLDGPLSEPASHESGCLWRRARESRS